DARRAVRRLEVEAEPLLNPQPAKARRPRRKVHKQAQVQRQRSRQNRVAAQEVHLQLHRIAEPAEDIDVVPTLFAITAWRVIVNAYLVIQALVQIGVQLRLQDRLQQPQLRLLLGLERRGIVQHLAVPVAQDV